MGPATDLQLGRGRAILVPQRDDCPGSHEMAVTLLVHVESALHEYLLAASDFRRAIPLVGNGHEIALDDGLTPPLCQGGDQ